MSGFSTINLLFFFTFKIFVFGKKLLRTTTLKEWGVVFHFLQGRVYTNIIWNSSDWEFCLFPPVPQLSIYVMYLGMYGMYLCQYTLWIFSLYFEFNPVLLYFFFGQIPPALAISSFFVVGSCFLLTYSHYWGVLLLICLSVHFLTSLHYKMLQVDLIYSLPLS